MKDNILVSACLLGVRCRYDGESKPCAALDKLKDEGTKLVYNYKGFGLYDKKVIEKIKEVDDPYPYFRGAVLDLGYRMKIIDFDQPERKNGVDKQNC